MSNETEPELSEKKLKWGYWYVTHQERLRRALIIGLIIFDTVFLGFSLTYFIYYAAVGRFNDERLVREIARPLINWPQLRSARQARNLEVIEVAAFSDSRGRANFAAWLRNPNPDFYAAFDYSFTGSFGTTPTKRGFILPGETKSILQLGLLNLTNPEGAELQLKNLDWRRLSRHQISDVSSYVQARINFSVDQVVYTPGSVLGLDKDRLTFEVVNNSIFSYAQVKLKVLFYSSGRLLGAEQTVVDKFLLGETKEVDLRLESLGLGAVEVKVEPEVDVFDANIYLKNAFK